MTTAGISILIFISGYLLNISYVSIFYHRSLAHKGVSLSPFATKFIALTGNWVTGLDPKGWVCMHRLHHRYSDTEKDPHSPHNMGIWGVMLGQLRSYEKILGGLIKHKKIYTDIVQDLNFPVSWLNRKRLWMLPYLFHLLISIAIGIGFNGFFGAAYYFGIMTHPIQGWLVNSFGHAKGYRNFNTPDKSTNNTSVAWLVAGEGYQNNHHQYPNDAKFSKKWWEFDYGYIMCHIFQSVRFLKINK
jgi:stearoyl-CoA desaturase (Delta-9 desaturase)